jgi:predicted DNA-binding mobile mystery protein A
MDTKMNVLAPMAAVPAPGEGWIHGVRTAINMTLEQLAKKLKITKQSVKKLEIRETEGRITLKSLKEVANALDMKLVYALVPKDGSLFEVVENKIDAKAREIVNRTSTSMALEDQKNEESRLTQAFEDQKNQLRNEMPKFIWD